MADPQEPPTAAPDRFAVAVERRTRLERFIREQLAAGVDFSTIHTKVNGAPCPRKFESDSWEGCSVCRRKPSLRQPGAERICDAEAVYIGAPELAADVVQAAQSGQNWVAFRITLTDRQSGQPLGHGIGAARHADPNIMVKKAKKNALIEAVRTTFALSGIFGEDGDTGETGDASAPAAAAPAAPRPAPAPAAALAPAQASATPPPAPAAPPPAPTPAPAPPPGGTIGQAAQGHNPRWWVIGREVPKADFQCQDKEGNQLIVSGRLHFNAADYPTTTFGQEQKLFFAPSDHPRAEFTRKAPWSEWYQMTWGQLFAHAVQHRLERAQPSETNRFSDPFIALLSDRYSCIYQGQAKPLGEHAAAMNQLAWNAVAKKRGHAPAAPPQAPPAPQPAPVPQQPAPAPQPAPVPQPTPSPVTGRGVPDDSDVPF